ncbi:hypothetical protein JOQ06_012195 [Pogonophryne albipinna]|uniref:Uncharacterized protein n=1 Tax=Pogonophryne albipinna TaxID=1090488 RepID=A0AAD6BCW4_9TELE|nr:hypothetical protein JOQ06_012195 [Pogonophryne albipinna]
MLLMSRRMVLSCNLAASDGPKHNVPEKLPAYSRNMRPGTVVHQEEPWTHRAPVADLTILVFYGKYQSSSIVPGSEYRDH